MIAAVILTPILSVLVSVLGETGDAWDRLAETVLPRYALNTLFLGGLVAIGVATIGVSTAWLVTMRSFPGARLFEILLVLPLAFPAYVIAYAYTDLLDHPGAVQTILRDITGWGPRDYWFPEIRSLPGAAAMLTLVLYPYVYLLARAAFINQSAAMLDVAKTLGRGPWRRFFLVALPMARPAIATGVALAMMETLADFGVVSHFGVQTFATGIYKAWFSMGDRVAAAQLSSWLLLFVLMLVGLERAQRGAARIHDTRTGFKAPTKERLTGLNALSAVLVCGLPVLLGFIAPLLMLCWMSAVGGHGFFGARYIGLTLNSVTLAGIAAIATVVGALLLAYAVRLTPSRFSRGASLVASMGYAVPGGVIAVGLLIPLASLDNSIHLWTEAQFGTGVGLVFSGTIFAVIVAYVVRFMSVALQTVEASLGKVTPAMDHAARTLGQSPKGALLRVHAPMIRGGLLTAGLIVFVDVLKELPATLILRPFDFDTLAIQAYRLASDERLLEASTPSLVIALAGLAPVILISREIRRSRPGAEGGVESGGVR